MTCTSLTSTGNGIGKGPNRWKTSISEPGGGESCSHTFAILVMAIDRKLSSAVFRLCVVYSTRIYFVDYEVLPTILSQFPWHDVFFNFLGTIEVGSGFPGLTMTLVNGNETRHGLFSTVRVSY